MSKPILIDQPNLSLAWAHAFLTLQATPGHRVSPLILTFTGFDPDAGPTEVPAIRDAMEASLSGAEMQRVQTVANTIFPQSLWSYTNGDRDALYAEYKLNLPEYVAMHPNKNRCGLYFGRLIAFHLDVKTGDRLKHVPDNVVPNDGNQLEFIIQHCKPGVRHSMFQASIYDPARDISAAAQIPFPCLQHLTFVPNFNAGTLELNAFYATQQLFERGYGNLLGLGRLGQFVASQTGLTLSRVTCFAGVEKMDKKPRASALNDLAAVCSSALERRVPALIDPSDVVQCVEAH